MPPNDAIAQFDQLRLCLRIEPFSKLDLETQLKYLDQLAKLLHIESLEKAKKSRLISAITLLKYSGTISETVEHQIDQIFSHWNLAPF